MGMHQYSFQKPAEPREPRVPPSLDDERDIFKVRFYFVKSYPHALNLNFVIIFVILLDIECISAEP